MYEDLRGFESEENSCPGPPVTSTSQLTISYCHIGLCVEISIRENVVGKEDSASPGQPAFTEGLGLCEMAARARRSLSKIV